MDYQQEINLTWDDVIDPTVLANLTDRHIVVDHMGDQKNQKLIPRTSKEPQIVHEGDMLFWDQDKTLNFGVPVITKTEIRSIQLPYFETEKSVIVPPEFARQVVKYKNLYLERRNIRYVLSPDMDTDDRVKSNEDYLYVERLVAYN